MNRTHNKKMICAVMLAACAATMSAAYSQNMQGNAENEVRTIHLTQDDGQVRYETRIFELEHASAESVLPFIRTAVLRYSANSNAQRVTSADNDGKNNEHAIMVTTGRDFMPYAEEIVKALDHDGIVDESGKVIKGTGAMRIAYTPKYRAARQFADLIDNTIASSEGKAYVNAENNTIFWQDQGESAKNTLEWVERLDRPLPQANIRLNYYELRESDLQDWGFDYVAWKNGPGVNILNVGYNAGRAVISETLQKLLQQVSVDLTANWSLAGFFTAPQFDMSFIRCLQQSGQANVTADATITALNTPVRSQSEYLNLVLQQVKNPDRAPYIYQVSMYPEYQNIQKNILGRTVVGKSFYEDEDGNKHSNPPVLKAKIINPFIFFDPKDGDADEKGFIPDSKEYYDGAGEIRKNGGVLFHYELNFKSIVERGNTGSELSNSAIFSGAATIGFNQEKVLSVYEKENDVEQTVGIPILCRIPILKYLFSTVTSIRERTYIIVSAEAVPVHTSGDRLNNKSVNTEVHRRIEKPLKPTSDEK